MEPTIGCLRARLRSAHRPPKRTGTAVGLRQFSRVASLFPPWSEGQCLAPSTDGRGPSRADNAPRRSRLQILPRALGRKARDHREAVREIDGISHTPPTLGHRGPRGRGSHRSMGRRSGRARHRSRVARTVASVKTRDRAVTRTWPSLSTSIRGGHSERPRAAPSLPHAEPRGTKQPRSSPRPGLLQSPLDPRDCRSQSLSNGILGCAPSRPAIQLFRPILLSKNPHSSRRQTLAQRNPHS